MDITTPSLVLPLLLALISALALVCPLALSPSSNPNAVGLSADDAASLLGISVSHFFNLAKTGRLGPEPRRLGKAVRYDRDELTEWFKAGCPPRSRWKVVKGGGR